LLCAAAGTNHLVLAAADGKEVEEIKHVWTIIHRLKIMSTVLPSERN
jgi:hypothetical protein